jgi:hypothetical protein
MEVFMNNKAVLTLEGKNFEIPTEYAKMLKVVV